MCASGDYDHYMSINAFSECFPKIDRHFWKYFICYRIGKAIARRLRQDGAKVMISSRKEANVAQTLEELKGEGSCSADDIDGMVCHVGKSDDRTRLVEKTIEKFGGIDILVSNAGTNPTFGPILNVKVLPFHFVSKVTWPILVKEEELFLIIKIQQQFYISVHWGPVGQNIRQQCQSHLPSYSSSGSAHAWAKRRVHRHHIFDCRSSTYTSKETNTWIMSFISVTHQYKWKRIFDTST